MRVTGLTRLRLDVLPKRLREVAHAWISIWRLTSVDNSNSLLQCCPNATLLNTGEIGFSVDPELTIIVMTMYEAQVFLITGVLLSNDPTF